jgi:CBS domain-containing protein
MQVREVMTTQVITVKEVQTKQQAARLLALHHISGLPVVNDENMVVGVVTNYDVIAKQGRLVKDIMTRGVISVSADTNLEEVGRILVHQRIRRVLVLDQGQLLGVVSRGDLVKEVATRWACPVCGEVMHSMLTPQRCLRCGSPEIATIEYPSPGS